MKAKGLRKDYNMLSKHLSLLKINLFNKNIQFMLNVGVKVFFHWIEYLQIREKIY